MLWKPQKVPLNVRNPFLRRRSARVAAEGWRERGGASFLRKISFLIREDDNYRSYGRSCRSFCFTIYMLYMYMRRPHRLGRPNLAAFPPPHLTNSATFEAAIGRLSLSLSLPHIRPLGCTLFFGVRAYGFGRAGTENNFSATFWLEVGIFFCFLPPSSAPPFRASSPVSCGTFYRSSLYHFRVCM